MENFGYFPPQKKQRNSRHDVSPEERNRIKILSVCPLCWLVVEYTGRLPVTVKSKTVTIAVHKNEQLYIKIL